MADKKLYQFILNGWELPAIQSVVAAENLDLNERSPEKATPLYWALDTQKEDIALWLIEEGVEAGPDELYAAAQRGLFQALQKLMEQGIPFDEPFEVAAFTPFLAAASEAPYTVRRNLKVTQKVDGKDVEITDPEEIERFAGPDYYGNYLKIIETLLDAGADVNYMEPKNNQHCLIFLGDRGGFEIAELCLKAGAKVNFKDNFGLTPLHWASRRGHLKIVQQYLEHGAAVNVQEAYGFSPLHEAAENNHPEVVKLLLEQGADKSLGLAKDFANYKAGDTAYTVAKKKNHGKVLLTLLA